MVLGYRSRCPLILAGYKARYHSTTTDDTSTPSSPSLSNSPRPSVQHGPPRMALVYSASMLIAASSSVGNPVDDVVFLLTDFEQYFGLAAYDVCGSQYEWKR
ncbi:uncharacterized protein LOC143264589 isoform X2 [Megachile rotundata]|uniref:uncharacterized protein LOC143264589 isoform X2 n=1 Tax=Megachile rotundata TaxID=143995 RepID=UPI003FD33B94